MSCGDPHEMDCREVLARVEVFLEHDLGAETATVHAAYQRIEHHLHECGPCEEQYEVAVFQLSAAVRAQMARCCAEHAPDELRLRVLQRLEALRSEPGSAR